jgi:glycosyltransferase involved in cell wall biosynthesis
MYLASDEVTDAGSIALAGVDHCASRSIAGRVAYLVNVYPKVSHSFIQTEIEALESLGIEVDRFTIRRSAVTVDDDNAQKTEAARTTALLDGNMRGLAGAVLRRFAGAPFTTAALLWRSLWNHRDQGPVRAAAYFAEAVALAQHLARRKVRHIHVHFGTNAVAVARLAAQLVPLTYSFTAHGPDEFDAPVHLKLSEKIADARFVVGVSSFGRGQLMRWATLADCAKIHIVRCAVSPAFLAAGLHTMPAEVPARFICVARLSAQKGLPLLIKAAEQVRRNRLLTIDIIGDGEDRAAIAGLIAELSLEGIVNLVGWRSSAQILRESETARALILPSFAEGLPVVLMEAMAVGRPVITTHVAGIPELVDDRVGWLVASGSTEALAQAMIEALDADRDRLQAMGEAGRERVCAMHDPDANASLLADYLLPFAAA